MMINATADDDKAKSGERQRGQVLNFLYVLVDLAFISFLVVFLRDEPDLMFRVISIVVSFIGGMGTGFTIAKRK
jgi:hypothetical protein